MVLFLGPSNSRGPFPRPEGTRGRSEDQNPERVSLWPLIEERRKSNETQQRGREGHKFPDPLMSHPLIVPHWPNSTAAREQGMTLILSQKVQPPWAQSRYKILTTLILHLRSIQQKLFLCYVQHILIYSFIFFNKDCFVGTFVFNIYQASIANRKANRSYRKSCQP